MENKVSLLITGDYCPINRMASYSESGLYGRIFNDFLVEIKKADFSITNLEAPATTATAKIQKTGPVLQVNPKAIETLRLAGFDLVTLANNHIMDLGKEGLRDTIKACDDYKMHYVGVGESNLEARKPFVVTINEKRIAIINIAENEFSTTNDERPGAAPLNPIHNFNDIQKAKQNAEYVVVIVHGGHEMYSLPTLRMVDTYRFFIDAGADAVVGHHTHCVSGHEVYKEKPIFYSLGNFVFDSEQCQKGIWCEGMAVVLIFQDHKIEFKTIPFFQNDKLDGVRLMNSDEQDVFYAKLSELNSKIENRQILEGSFDDYCLRVKKMYSSYLEPHRNKWVHALRNRGYLPPFLDKDKRNLYLNLIRCEAHRDVVLRILRNSLN